MKINLKNLFWAIGLALVCYCATLSLLVGRFLPGAIRYVIPFVIMGLFLLAGRLRLKQYVPAYYIPWVAFFLFAAASVLMNKLGHLMAALTMFMCIVLGILLMSSTQWLGIGRKVLAWFTGIYIFFTYFFFAFPSSYPIMIDLYGQAPIGTYNGQKGYQAGLADHYSSNGMYISVFLMLMVVLWLTVGNRSLKEKREKKLCLLMSILGAVALLLTTKRGVLLWSLMAILITYWIVSRRKIQSLFKLLGVALLGYGAVLLLTRFIPEVGAVFERFETMGEDGASLERIAMWELAWKMFQEKPIFGAGFWAFPKRYASDLFGIYNTDLRYKYSMAAHNVYFQVLCETGIVGFSVYLAAVGMTLRETLRLVRKYSRDENAELRFAVLFSLCIQIFYLLYSLSGNCLYDFIFYFYGMAMAMTTAVHYHDIKTLHQPTLKRNGQG